MTLHDQFIELFGKTTKGEWAQGSWKDCLFTIVDGKTWKQLLRIQTNKDDLKEGNTDLHDAEFIVFAHNNAEGIAKEFEFLEKSVSSYQQEIDSLRKEAQQQLTQLRAELQKEQNSNELLRGDVNRIVKDTIR